MSPIIGLTDRDSITPRFPRLGKLRKGAEKPERGPGKELSYFRFTSENPEIEEAFTAAYGKEPQVLHVYLPHATVEENFTTWQEEWVAGGLKHRCDGVTASIWLQPDGTYSREPKPCPGGCSAVGRLELILPELLTAGFVGYVTLETHSNHDLRNITAALMATEDARKDAGLQGIKFTLRRKKESISTPGKNGKRASRDKWLVYLEPEPEWVTLQLQLASSAQALLPEPDEPEVDDDTGEIIEGETTVVTEPPKPSNGNGARPLPAEGVKAMLLRGVEKYADDPKKLDTGDWGAVTGKLQEAGNGDKGHREQERHMFLDYVFGEPSTKKLTDAQGKAIRVWLYAMKPDDTGAFPLNAHVEQEFRHVVEAMRLQQGQTETHAMPEGAEA